MRSRIVFAFALLGLAIASAKTYDVTLYSPVTVGGTELKPGQTYKTTTVYRFSVKK